MNKLLPLLLIVAASNAGCVYTSYKQGDKSLTRISVFGNQTVGKIDLMKGTMEGYTSEQAEVAGAAVSAAIKAATGR